MRLAKLGTRHSNATRVRMSRSHTGLVQTEVSMPVGILQPQARLLYWSLTLCITVAIRHKWSIRKCLVRWECRAYCWSGWSTRLRSQ